MDKQPFPSKARHQSSFTLVEIIVGIVITGISLAVVTTLIYPLFARSVDPMLQVRAAEYAQAIMQDIQSKRYDETTGVGGQPLCSSCSITNGTVDGETDRRDFDDVDDFNEYCDPVNPATPIQNVLGNTVAEYSGYQFSSCIEFAGADFGQAAQAAKRITVIVAPPSPATPVTLSAYRGNY